MAEGSNKLAVQVLTPEGEVFEGEVLQLSTKSSEGELGIRARHIPIVARLVETELRLIHDEGNVTRYRQGPGWLEVFANRARVLVDSAEPLE